MIILFNYSNSDDQDYHPEVNQRKCILDGTGGKCCLLSSKGWEIFEGSVLQNLFVSCLSETEIISILKKQQVVLM
jgi:hypothetical protein